MEKICLWYAVSGTGQGLVFLDKPQRDDKWKRWLGHIEGCVSQTVCLIESNGFRLPSLKWSDEPIMLELTLKQIGNATILEEEEKEERA